MARPAVRTWPAAACRGPYQTERQAARVAAAMRAAADGTTAARNQRMLLQACAAAAVQLGDWDRRVLAWLAGWEPATCAVIAGLIWRAAGAAPAPAGRREEERAR